MERAFIRNLPTVLAMQRNRGAITSAEEEILALMLRRAAEQQAESAEALANIDIQYIRGRLSHEQAVEAKREKHCYERPFGRKELPSSCIDRLLQREILIKCKGSVALREPVELTPFRVSIFGKNRNLSRRLRDLLFSLLKDFRRLTGRLLVELPDRKAIFDFAALNAPHESAIYFAGSPAIFNPFEPVEKPGNHTEDFCLSLRHLKHEVLYVWNERRVLDQIRKHIRECGLPAKKLIQQYTTTLSRWLSSGRIKVFVGDNATHTEEDRSYPYISKSWVLRAERRDGRLDRGKAFNRGCFLRWKDKAPGLRAIPDEVFSFRERTDYDDLRKMLHKDMNYTRLMSNDKAEVSAFVRNLFARSTV